MAKNPTLPLYATLVFLLVLSACAPTPITETRAFPEGGEAHIIPASVELRWPELATSELCPPQVVQPEIEFCLLNDGTAPGVVPEEAYLLMPGGAAPGMVGAVLNSLPGGSWAVPEPIKVSGLPGVEGELVALLFKHILPTAEGTQGMIFVCVPTLGGCDQGLILFILPQSEEPTQGLWIGAPDLTGNSQVMGLVMQDKPGEDGSEGIIVADTIPATQGELAGIVLGDTPPPDDNKEGILFKGGLLGPDGIVQAIIVIDQKHGEGWAGRGILLLETMPGPGDSVEGILVVDTMPGEANVSQLMPVMVDSLPGEAGSVGMIVEGILPPPDDSEPPPDDNLPTPDDNIPPPDDSIPPPDDNQPPPDDNRPPPDDNQPPPDDSLIGIDWGGLLVGLEGGTGSESQAVLLGAVPSSGALGINGNSLPFGFDPQGMMALMGEGGFGPGPQLIGKLNLQPLASDQPLEPGEQDCFWPQISLNLGGSDGNFHIDSFFDVFTDLSVSMPPDESGALETRRFPVRTPPYEPCTPTPSPTLPDLQSTPTPTPRQVAPPTATPRTGLPTNTPGRSVPTATPGR